jgi:hypothetical protein
LSIAKIWSGDWHGRILERVHARGFATVTQYAEANPDVSLLVLAEDLGPDDVASGQIRSILVDEAVQIGSVSRLLRDLFVRELCYSLSHGWRHPLDAKARARVARVLAFWRAELEFEDLLDCIDEESLLKAGQDFMDAERPTGWLPDGPDDPVIIAFVERCLRRARD